MSQKSFDWTYFRRRIYIRNCTIDDLFKKWATPKGLTEWFIAEADYEFGDNNLRKPDEIVQADDRYTWKFHRGSVVTGKVLEVKKNSLFKFTFGKKEPDSEEDVIVTVTFHDKNGNCGFDILQENMSESKYGKVYYYISCNMGWMFHMNNLKSLYEAGHDLRVKGENRMHVDAPSAYPLDQYKWTEFRQIEYIKAPREAVFAKWVTSNNIITWFIAEAVYNYDGFKTRKPDEKIKAGDNYTWTFFQGITQNGKIIDLVENEYLSFTFGKKEPGSEEDVIVELFFSSESENRTRIELHQMNIADSEYGHVHYNLSCIAGWCYFLTNLRSVFESGYDLRVKEKNLALESQQYTLER
jgi:uncharacterized protein YndB with AHSA1/START domain